MFDLIQVNGGALISAFPNCSMVKFEGVYTCGDGVHAFTLEKACSLYTRSQLQWHVFLAQLRMLGTNWSKMPLYNFVDFIYYPLCTMNSHLCGYSTNIYYAVTMCFLLNLFLSRLYLVLFVSDFKFCVLVLSFALRVVSLCESWRGDLDSITAKIARISQV